MRGKVDTQVTMLTLITVDQLVAEDHPIRQIKPIVDKALIELSPTFNRAYAETGSETVLYRSRADGEQEWHGSGCHLYSSNRHGRA